MKRKNTIDYRKTQRLDIHLRSKCRLSSKGKRLLQVVFTKNISGGGISLTLTKPLKVGTKLPVLLYFPNDPKPVCSLSQIVWCKPNPKKYASFDVGIRHIKIAAKDRERFAFLFCETMINYFLVAKKTTA